jgi:RTX calcium-binding nonapeptide repeat (4 copies)
MAKPIKGTKGNDTITSGPGDEHIDGGQGIDTIVFSGDFDDYVLTFKPQGRNGHGSDDSHLTISGPDGVDRVKNAEFLQFADRTFDVATGVSYQVNATVDPSAQDPAAPGTLFAGTGIPATDFGIVTNESAGVELGLQVIYRQGPTVTTTDDYADDVLNFAVNDGPQSTVNGSSSNNPSRAAWSFEYSVATGLNGETTDLDDFTFQLLYDVDPGAGTSYRTLTLEAETTPQGAGQSGYQWRDAGTGLVFISDDEGNANVTQNSENYAFSFFQAFLGGAYAPPTFTGPAEFDIILQALDGSNNLIAQNHISVDVIL